MFLFCLVFALFCARLFICASWSPAGKGLTSWLSFVVSSVSLSLSHWYPGSGVVLDCIDSWSLQPYLLSEETSCIPMITRTNNAKRLALLHQVVEIYEKVYTSNSLLETGLYWGLSCIECVENIRIFMSAQQKWKFWCYQLTRWNIFGIYPPPPQKKKKLTFLYSLYFL